VRQRPALPGDVGVDDGGERAHTMHVVRALYDGVRVLCGVATGPCEVTRGRYDVTQVR
jgi:hypothetical protein